MKTQLTIRVTEYQAEEIRANAERHSLPVSAYLIALGVSGASPLPPRTRGTGSRRERPVPPRGRGALAAVRAEPPEAAVRAEPGEPHACADPDCDEYLAADDTAQFCKAHTQGDAWIKAEAKPGKCGEPEKRDGLCAFHSEET